MESKQTNADNKPTKKTSAKQIIEWHFGADKKYEFSTRWYALMTLVLLALLALAIFVIKSWTFVALLLISSLALVLYIRRPSIDIKYKLDGNEITIDTKSYALDAYKAFGVIQNLSGSHKIILLPTKRFAPALELDISDTDGEVVVDFLGARLPMKKIESNFIDNIVQRIGL